MGKGAAELKKETEKFERRNLEKASSSILLSVCTITSMIPRKKTEKIERKTWGRGQLN